MAGPDGGAPPGAGGGRRLPSADARERLRPPPRSDPAPPSLAGAPPDAGVPREVRDRRAAGAALALALLVGSTGLALVVAARWPAPPTDDGPPGEPPLPAEVVEALGRPVAAAGPIRDRARPPAPRPADATLHLPPGHRYTAWRLRCGSTTFPLEHPEGELAPGQEVLVVRRVPPTDCHVALVGDGAPSVPVTAGALRRCRREGTLVCERPDGSSAP